jgi:Domain of unknown function (DUF4337)
MSNTHEHLEQAEHAEHHRSDPFNQKVAVSMAIVAACLAGISMIGHRTHNEVLQLQGDSNRLRTEAATAEVEMSNLFAWYQAKKVRQAQYELSSKMVELLPGGDDATRKNLSKDWEDKAKGYETKNDKKDGLPDLDERGKEAGKHAEELKEKARTIRDESDYVHLQADRIDIAHLLAEVALVLCSITLLTKKKLFWYIGLLTAVLAIGLTISAYMIPHEAHHHSAIKG